MKHNKKITSLLKIIFKNSYDLSNYIDEETKKINKKSSKVWALWIITFIVIYISYALLNFLKDAGIQSIFLGIFFFAMQTMIIFQSAMICGNIFFFSKDNENYLYMPISTAELIISKLGVVFSIIIGAVSLIMGPAILLYGIRTIQPLLFFILLPVVIIFITFAYSLIVTIITIIVTRIFKFIKNRKIYQQIVTTVITLMAFIPLLSVVNILNNAIQVEGKISQQTINRLLKFMPVTNIGIDMLTKLNWNSLIGLLKLIAICLGIFFIFLMVGKILYLKNVLTINSIFVKRKKKKKIKIKNTNKKRGNKYLAYVVNDLKAILKNQTYFTNYIYKILIILVISLLVVFSIAQAIEKLTSTIEAPIDFSLTFESFSIVIGIIQILFTFSTVSLTAISRYGKTAIFLKYIPIKQRTQFSLKLIPGILINTIIVIVTCFASNKILKINTICNVGIITIGMLLNVINCCILLLIDLWRPQLNFENEITTVKQNDNNILKYILTVVMCFILWYLKEITKELEINKSILVEGIVFSIILGVIWYIIVRKKEKLFKNIY